MLPTKTNTPNAPATPITDPVIIGRIGTKDTFMITSRTDATTSEIAGTVTVSYWNPSTERWSPEMPLDQLVRFLPFDFYRAELSDHGLTYPGVAEPEPEPEPEPQPA